MIDNNIEHLVDPYKTKCKVFLEVCRKKYPRLWVFETLRNLDRQKWLVQNGKSWTLKSYHLKWLAADYIFYDKNNNPTRKWDYAYLKYVWVMCGMETIAKEQCHLQDNGKAIPVVMKTNSTRRASATPTDKKLLSSINDLFRRYWYK